MFAIEVPMFEIRDADETAKTDLLEPLHITSTVITVTCLTYARILINIRIVGNTLALFNFFNSLTL
jgi:hypothetical protein